MSDIRGGEGQAEVRRRVVTIATQLDAHVDEISRTIWLELEGEIDELRGDARMSEMLGASVRGNVEAIVHALRAQDTVEGTSAPSAALDYARRLADRGVPVNALVRAYRLGQRRLTELVFAELRDVQLDPTTQVAVIEAITTAVFEYVDRVSQQVVAAYEGERDRRLQNQNSIRAVRVRDVLGTGGTGADIDIDAASAAVGYPLRWHHLALIAWYPGDAGEGDRLARVQRFSRDVAVAVGASADPLFAAAEETSGWIWLPFKSAPGGIPGDLVTKLRDYTHARPDAFSIAMGAVGSGLGGFRRSHRQALRVRHAVQARGWEQRAAREIVAATDHGMVESALLATSVGEIRGWVADVLGPLSSDSGDAARLRDMLRISLAIGSGYETAARTFKLDYNALKDQVARAVARRGRPINDRLDVSLALQACHRYGSAVLQRDDGGSRR